MTEQSEWATDYVFRSPEELARWYPRFVQHGILNLSCKDVMRYLGKQVPDQGYGCLTGEAKIDRRDRPEGTRLKFWYNTNSIKFYDKEKIALRIETTINQPMALLKAHGLILRVQKTHHYRLTAQGRRIVTTLLASHTANAQQFSAAA